MKFNKILMGIVVLHLIFVVISINQPFHGDEVVLVEAAKAVLKTGVPIIDLGQNNPNFSVLVHIPFHIYLLSGFIYLFGEGIYAIRGLSALFNMLTIFMIYLITKEILKDNEKKEVWGLVAAFLYALNPFTIQNSVLIDPDSILNFAMYLFLYLFIKNKNWFYLIPSLLFIFFAKEFGAPLLFLCITLFYIITSNWKKIIKLILLFSICGIFWLIIWGIFSNIMNLDFMQPIIFNFGVLSNISGGSGGGALSILSLLARLWNFKNFFYFAVPFFVSLFFLFTFIFYYKIWKNKERLKKEETKNILLFNILALLIVFLYLFMGGSGYGFPKYHIIALPSICIFVTFMLAKSNISQYIKKILKEKRILFILIIIILLFYFLIFITDPLMPEFDLARGNINIMDVLPTILIHFSLYVLIPFFICLGIFSLFKIKGKLWVCLIYLSLFMFFYLNILHAVVDYSTYAKYGDTGIPEVIKYLKENEIPPSEIVTHCHIGSYLGIENYNEISFIYNDPETFTKEVLEKDNIKYMVIWERDIQRIGENMKFFDLEKQIGTYYIFKKNAN